MANKKHLEILRQGVEVWNEWRLENPSLKIDLSGADLRQASLASINFEGVNLSRANLSKATFVNSIINSANLNLAILNRADLSGANLSDSDLSETLLCDTNLFNVNSIRAIYANSKMANSNLDGANLWGASFGGADLRGVNLHAANLQYCNFSKAILGNTVFGNSDLSQTRGMENIFHRSPSSISIDVFSLSKGNIPEIFLRGCGLSDADIEYCKLSNPSLNLEQATNITYRIHQLYLGGGIKYYSSFISYNSKDEVFARQLYNDLQNNGVRCWFAPEDMKIGDQIRPRIDQEIRLRDKLLVILSENSVKSEWVGDEVEAALEEESKSKRSVLFPIRLDDTVMSARDDWAAKIKRRRHIGDFSNWKDKASYQKAFERLLRDLKATDSESGR